MRALVLKFWFHLSRTGQKQRLKALAKDPRTAWRVTKASYDRLKTYDALQRSPAMCCASPIAAPRTPDHRRGPTTSTVRSPSVASSSIRWPADCSRASDRGSVAPPIVKDHRCQNVLTELDLGQKLAKKV